MADVNALPVAIVQSGVGRAAVDRRDVVLWGADVGELGSCGTGNSLALHLAEFEE